MGHSLPSGAPDLPTPFSNEKKPTTSQMKAKSLYFQITGCKFVKNRKLRSPRTSNAWVSLFFTFNKSSLFGFLGKKFSLKDKCLCFWAMECKKVKNSHWRSPGTSYAYTSLFFTNYQSLLFWFSGENFTQFSRLQFLIFDKFTPRYLKIEAPIFHLRGRTFFFVRKWNGQVGGSARQRMTHIYILYV